ncbi:hypothetical protein VII00023_18084 [Vibrio ichthyoenteri ATCC 700023]|uniref:Uncharacterized protein n=1 Tax=Vibrio ichthyoenteri ATCC 700023 TaxID=870968 RepID=F9RX32_9VIBR|nr:hypothetical protein [Vibrio ichthyoenteri]EGU48461.1 hypothetical protein VII00023_18084 [Vibrio ichthyoenteri ATCC 700023]
MKNVLIIALSVFSVSAFAAGGAASNNGLNGDLIQQATVAGLSTEQATQGVATGHITTGMGADQMLEITSKMK